VVKGVKIPAPYVRSLGERYADAIAGYETNVAGFYGFLGGE
jgi:hypothetical protein